uniref:(California timema) hypothetical protein n=1 Tax=Timema californicum TaxID=61474 RepID=A0A7R9JJ59_TIMCA|nr:unnamed protein product [Timema californicum]
MSSLCFQRVMTSLCFQMSMSDQEQMMMMTTAAPAPMMPPMTGTIFMMPRRTGRDVSKMDPPSDEGSESSTHPGSMNDAQDKRSISPVHEDECANSRIFPGSIHSEGSCGTPGDAAQHRGPEDVAGVFREIDDAITPEDAAPEDVAEAAPTYLDWGKDNDHEDDLQVHQKR